MNVAMRSSSEGMQLFGIRSLGCANKDNLLNWLVGYYILFFFLTIFNVILCLTPAPPATINIKATPIHMATRMQQREMVKWFKFFTPESFQLIDVQK